MFASVGLFDHLFCSSITGEKRAKVRKPKLEFPVYEIPADSLNYQMYDQTTSIEDIEDQMDDWLQDGKASKKKVGWRAASRRGLGVVEMVWEGSWRLCFSQ